MIYFTFTLILLATISWLVLGWPGGPLFLRIARCRLAIRLCTSKIRKLQKRLDYFSSEAFTLHLRVRGWYEPGLTSMSPGYHYQPKADEEILKHQALITRFISEEISKQKFILRGMREQLVTLLEQQREKSHPADEAELRKQLAYNQRQTEKLQKQLERVTRRRERIELALLDSSNRSGYREQPRVRVGVQSTEALSDQGLDEIDEILDEEPTKKSPHPA